MLQALRQRGLAVRPVFCTQAAAQAADGVAVPTLDAATDWAYSLAGVDVVVHCAVRAHVMRDEALNPLTVYAA